MSSNNRLLHRNYSAIAIFILIAIAVISFFWQQKMLNTIENQNEAIIAQLEEQITFLKGELLKPDQK